MKRLFTFLSALFGIASIALISTSFARAAELPVEHFFKKAEMSDIKLSPDGKFIAARARYKGRLNLMAVELANRQGARLTAFEDQDISTFSWANNNRLLFEVGDLSASEGAPTYGLFAINKDGTEPKALVEPKLKGKNKVKDVGTVVVRRTRYYGKAKGGSEDEIIVAATDRDAEAYDLYKMNIKTGKKSLLTFSNPGKTAVWVSDHNGVPRVAVTSDWRTTASQVYYRTDEKSEWKMLAENKFRDSSWAPIAFDFDNKMLFVRSNIGRDTEALYRFDPEKNQMGELIAEDAAYDIATQDISTGDTTVGLLTMSKKVVGVRYEADKEKIVWFDQEARKLQDMVDTALPGRINRVAVRNLTETTAEQKTKENDTDKPLSDKLVVTSYSDRHSPAYFLLDIKSKTLEPLGESRPWINSDDLAETKPISYVARDGMTIRGYLTLPKGSNGKNLPLIAHPHGGPWARDSWGFNPEVQFLANRGYAVLQMDFRSSIGYGKKLLEAGYKQWGLAMQDDITDSVNWAVKEGIADKNRVCIYGASYGGYATVMGLVKTPELYRCGINYVGVTDIDLLFSLNPAYTKTGRAVLTQMVGDPSKDKAQFDATSPLKNADKIRVPVLMAYGGEDYRVDLEHGNLMKNALQKTGKLSEYIVKMDEGHGFRQEDNMYEYYTKVEKFLKANLN